MGYCKKIYKAGSTLIVEKSYRATQLPRGHSRAKKIHPTSEAVRKNNEWMAIKKLTVLMNANFKPGDWHIVLTYRRDERPTPEAARANLEKFLRKLRRSYKRIDNELKYIHCTEYVTAAIHHHILLNKIDISEVQAAWPHGQVRPAPVYSANLQKLAEYFVKETRKTFTDNDSPYKQRYVPSRNLVRPEAKAEEVNAREWAKEPKEIAGYYIDKNSVVNGISEVTGYPYQYYILVAINNRPKKRCKSG